ncbi:MAG: NUDIX hydrolase [Holosporales bacterium]
MNDLLSSAQNIHRLVNEMIPFDDQEAQHLTEVRAWIASGAPLYRVQKPDVPDQHLVAYFVLFEEEAQKILLVDHRLAQLWLPTGGHVEPDEDPTDTVRRECFEELGVQAEFWLPHPVFITKTETVGLTAGHTDVSLWYVLRGKDNAHYTFDRGEFREIHWFYFDDIPYERSDPHMKRFIAKLRQILRRSNLASDFGS